MFLVNNNNNNFITLSKTGFSKSITSISWMKIYIEYKALKIKAIKLYIHKTLAIYQSQ